MARVTEWRTDRPLPTSRRFSLNRDAARRWGWAFPVLSLLPPEFISLSTGSALREGRCRPEELQPKPGFLVEAGPLDVGGSPDFCYAGP